MSVYLYYKRINKIKLLHNMKLLNINEFANEHNIPKTENKKGDFQKKSFLIHVVDNRGDIVCNSRNNKNAGALAVHGKPLVKFIEMYNNPDTKHMCCEHCRDLIKNRQVAYKEQNGGTLKGFKL